MTDGRLNDLLDIQSDVTDMLTSILNIYSRVKRLSLYDEDVMAEEAHKALKDSRMGLLATHEQAVDVFKSMMKAYDAEKALKNTYNALLNKQDNDER